MHSQPFTFPVIDFTTYAQRSDIRCSQLCELIAAYQVEAGHNNGIQRIESQEQYSSCLKAKTQTLRSLLDNAIDSGDVLYSKRTATAEVEEINDIQETLYALGENPNDSSVVYDVRDNLDINIRSFTLWAAEKRIVLPAAFYAILIEPPKGLTHSGVRPATGIENTKVTDGLLKMLVAIAMDAYGYNPDDKKSTVTQDILNALDACGLSLSENTIRTRLKEAAQLLPRDVKTP